MKINLNITVISLLALYILLFPFLGIPGLMNPFMGKLYIVQIVLLFFIIYYLWNLRRDKGVYLFDKNDVFLLLFLFYLGLCSLTSDFAGFARRGWVIYLSFVLIYAFSKYILVSNPDLKNFFVKLFVCSSTVFAVYGLIIVFFYRPWRLRIFFGNTLFLSNIFLAAVPVIIVIIAGYLKEWKKNRVMISLWCLAFLANLLALYFTKSKTAILVCGVAILLPISLIYKKWRKLAILIIVFFTVTGLSLVLFLEQSGGNSGTAAIRYQIYRGTSELIKNNLILGTGPYTYFLSYPEYITQEYFKLPLSADVTNHAHSYFPEIIAESGLPGFILLIIFVGLLLYKLGREALTPSRHSYLAAGVFSALVVTYLYNLFNINQNVEYFAPWLWILLGVAASFTPGTGMKVGNIIFKKTLYFVLLAISGVLIFAFLKSAIISEYYFARGANARAEEAFKKASFYFNKGLEEQPYNTFAVTMAAYIEGELGNYENAIKLYDFILKISPYYGHTLYNKANVYLKLGRYDEAEALYIQYLKHNPYHSESRINLGMIYTLKNDYVSALKANLSIFEYDNTNYNAAYNCGTLLFKLGDTKEAQKWLEGALKLIRVHKENTVKESLGSVNQNVLDNVRKYETEEASILANIALIYKLAGKEKEAEEYMSGALELDGDDPQIKEIADKFFEGKN
ncbi:MAG: O-antigen ligase family protein [Candidatus Aureabacteria bacterium]|nr:O-antigen ligase family protein [Candidatus Auribacterota bacterium]